MILDPRDGDIEDDASSTHQRSLLSLAGSLFAEISLPKLLAVWIVLLLVPALLLGAAPLVATAWAVAVWDKTANVFTEFWPALLLPPLAAIGWFGGRRALRLAESSFWSLNALAVQPVYVIFREGLRHLAEALLPARMTPPRRSMVRALSAAVSGLVVFVLGSGAVALLWPATRWIGSVAGLASAHLMVPVLLANSLSLIAAYCAVAALVWGVGDALMAQPRDLAGFAPAAPGDRVWRVAHLSDIHTVGERYGFRIESGRAGPRGNDRLQQTLARLDAIHAEQPLDFVLVTGDLTDAGRSAEWAEFFLALAAYPALAERVVALPGNHDVNVVDRASPARMELQMSPTKRLRQLRTLSALERLQGGRVRVVDFSRRGPAHGGRPVLGDSVLGDSVLGDSVLGDPVLGSPVPGGPVPGSLLTEALAPHAAGMAAFADSGSPRRLSRALAELWDAVYPMVLPPATPDGLGIIILNSNAETHFSFTNALGVVSSAQAKRIRAAAKLYPQACWIIALHHHLIEYPQKANALSMRIGTALVNGSWMIRQLQRLAGRAVIMHGHRHTDWIGQCGRLLIVSAPSPVMAPASAGAPYFYVHSLAIGADAQLKLRQAERVEVAL
jgi:3',5'-cyclic AMP phosphodiesterase CpdA